VGRVRVGRDHFWQRWTNIIPHLPHMCSPYVAMGTTLEVSLPVCKSFGILYRYINHCIGLVKCGLSQTPHVHKPCIRSQGCCYGNHWMGLVYNGSAIFFRHIKYMFPLTHQSCAGLRETVIFGQLSMANPHQIIFGSTGWKLQVPVKLLLP